MVRQGKPCQASLRFSGPLQAQLFAQFRSIFDWGSWLEQPYQSGRKPSKPVFERSRPLWVRGLRIVTSRGPTWWNPGADRCSDLISAAVLLGDGESVSKRSRRRRLGPKPGLGSRYTNVRGRRPTCINQQSCEKPTAAIREASAPTATSYPGTRNRVHVHNID